MKRTGFTLIELTLAMGCIVMLSVTLYASLSVALGARKSALRATAATRSASIVANLVKQDLESIPPPTGTYCGPFIGVTDAMQFCTMGRDDPHDESPLAEGVRRVELMLRSDVNPPALVRRVTRNLQPASTADYVEEVLARDVRTFSLRYFDGGMWQESWDSAVVGDVLPMAVGVMVEVGDAARADAPVRKVSIVVPLSCAKPADVSMGGL
jgi:type II secretory pathway pseudopilin PulG